MSDTTRIDMPPDRSYMPGEHPDLPPPATMRGVVGWIRHNLFSSVFNTTLTIFMGILLWWLVPPMAQWFFIDAAYTGEDRSDCLAKASGACWAFINERLQLFTYGFYPAEYRWRVDLSFILMCFALVPVLFDNVPYRKYGLYYVIAFPFIAAWLLMGGDIFLFELAPVSTDQFGGFMLTLVIGITGIAFSLPIGIVLALGRMSKLPIIHISSVCFIEFIRGVPLITLLFVASVLLNYFLPPGTSFDLLLRVLIMVTLFASGYMAEVIRGGLQAIPSGQFEAADGLGFKYWQSMRLIVLPQALKISIPSIVNTFIGLYKDTTLVIIIGLLDPLGVGRASIADAKWAGLSTELYVFVALFFFISCFSMARYSMYLENKLHTSHKR